MSTDLEVVESPQGAVTLFGSDDPVTIVQKATAIADALKDVIVRKKLVANISGKSHVLVDGWTLCGTMLGVFPVVVRTTELHDDDGNSVGFEAYCEARTRSGSVVGAATARCTRGENSWKNRADYALLSMAQTRSVSKAMRIPLGFIISMAGYEATPAEEMHEELSAPAQDSQAKLQRIQLVREVKKQHSDDPLVTSNEIGRMTLEAVRKQWPDVEVG